MPNHLEQADKATQANTFTPDSVYAMFASTAYEPRKSNVTEKPDGVTDKQSNPDKKISMGVEEDPNKSAVKDGSPSALSLKEREAMQAASAAEKMEYLRTHPDTTKPEDVPPSKDWKEPVKQENPGEWWTVAPNFDEMAKQIRPIAEVIQAAELAKLPHSYKDVNASSAMGLSKLSKSGELPGLLIVDDMNVNFKANKH